MKTLPLAIMMLLLTTRIAPRKLNFTRLASQYCEVCEQESPIHEMHKDRLLEVTISKRGNIADKISILGLQNRVRGVLIAPNRILSTADYFSEHPKKSVFYAYYGYLENLDDSEGFQVQKITITHTHPSYVPGLDEYNVAVSEVVKKFEGPFAHVSEKNPHFIEAPVGEDCNIIGYLPGNTVRLFYVNMHSRRECMDRYGALKLNTNLTGNTFCITLRNAAEISAEVNVDGAPVVCETTVYGLMLLHTHKELELNDPIPALFIGTESFWIHSKALHLKAVRLTSAGTSAMQFSWTTRVYEFFYQNVYW